MIPGSSISPFSGYSPFQGTDSIEAEKQRAKMDQLEAAKDMNDAKKDTYDKATIQARN